MINNTPFFFPVFTTICSADLGGDHLYLNPKFMFIGILWFEELSFQIL